MKVSSRGVWIAPWRGPNDELVLFAQDSKAHLVTDPVTIPHGADRVAIADGLWDLLTWAEPEPDLVVGRPPRFRYLPRSRRLRRPRLEVSGGNGRTPSA